LYLEEEGIEDDNQSRASALFDIQKFANKIDSSTYDKMVDSLMSEKKSSRASMRYSSFPDIKMLENDPRVFNAILQTTLDMKDTPHALIFSLDLKRDMNMNTANDINPNAMIDSDEIDFSKMSFIDFLKLKLLELEEDFKDGVQLSEQIHLEDYKSLFNNYMNFDENQITTQTSILV